MLLGLLGSVIYPVLPDRAIDPWHLVNPREAWLTVLLIAVLGFANYVLLKTLDSRRLYYTAAVGGMVNSTATIAELSTYLKNSDENTTRPATVINLITFAAMFLRNLLILVVFSRATARAAAGPMVIMAVASAVIVWQQRRQIETRAVELKLSSPLPLLKVLRFGALFLAIEVLGSLGQRHFGTSGLFAVSFLGGFVSSASSAGAAATLAMHQQISPHTAGFAVVLTSMTSALSNLPLIHQQVREWKLTPKLALITFGIIGLGLAVQGLWSLF